MSAEEEGGGKPRKPRLAAAFDQASLQAPWKEEPPPPQAPLPWEEETLLPSPDHPPPSETAMGPQGKAPLPPLASFKEPLLDGWDQPAAGDDDVDDACDPQAGKNQEKRGLPGIQIPLVRPLPVDNEITHPQRIAAITSDMCDMLLGGDVRYQGCMSTVAAFILEREFAESHSPSKETYELVALGTGDVCYGGWFEFSGRRIHDLHGLVVARRALLRYLYKQLLLYSSQDPTAREKSIFGPAGAGAPLALKPKHFLHLYLSRVPSRAAENCPSVLPPSVPPAGLQVSVKGRPKPVSYCRPSVLSARVCCVSGCDKLMRWSILGVQGALLSHIICPLRITSIILADPYQDRAALHRIINDRVQLAGLGDEGLVEPYGQKQVYIFEGPRVAPLETPPECRFWSLNWCGGDESLEVVNGTLGMAVRDTTSPGDGYRPSRLCKAAMLKYFRAVAQEMPREELALMPTYHEAKVQAEAYQSAKRQMYAQISLQDLGKWPQKQLVDIFAS